MCVDVFPSCMYVCVQCRGPMRSEVGIQSPGIEVQAFVNYHMDSGIGLRRAAGALDH